MSTPQEVWEAPIKTEGVSGEADRPASPGEQVADAPGAPADTQPTAPVQPLDWNTAPSQFRETWDRFKPLTTLAEKVGGVEKFLGDYEAEKPLRELARDLGGVDAVREAVAFDDLWRNPTVEPSEKISRLRQASEREFERVGGELVEHNWQKPEWQDYLLQKRFGMTAAQIEQRLSGAQPQPASQEFDHLTYARQILDDPLSNEHDKVLARRAIEQAEELARQKEALAKVPELEKSVNSFSQLQEERRAEQVGALVNDFTREAFAPAEKIIAAAFPPVPGESDEDRARREYYIERVRRDVFDEVAPFNNPKHPNHGLATEVKGYLDSLDSANARRKLPKLQALAEMAAERYVSFLSTNASQRRQAQSQPLEREPNPKVVSGSGASFGQGDSIPSGREAWNDPNMKERWQEIAASVK